MQKYKNIQQEDSLKKLYEILEALKRIDKILDDCVLLEIKKEI